MGIAPDDGAGGGAAENPGGAGGGGGALIGLNAGGGADLPTSPVPPIPGGLGGGAEITDACGGCCDGAGGA